MTEVRHPLIISSRLMAALPMPNVGTLHLHAERRDAENRVVYSWVVEDADGHELGKGEDISSGVRAAVDYTSAMSTLIHFLVACGVSYPDGENAEMFPQAVAEWAQQYSDELDAWGEELTDDD